MIDLLNEIDKLRSELENYKRTCAMIRESDRDVEDSIRALGYFKLARDYYGSSSDFNDRMKDIVQILKGHQSYGLKFLVAVAIEASIASPASQPDLLEKIAKKMREDLN